MDQEKIGNFIAECRKAAGYTQASLAEELFITDRAVSKWENGKCLPDAAIMLKLCKLLKINVNELLSGEHIAMDNYKENAESLLVEMREKAERADKNLLLFEKFMLVIVMIFYFAMIAVSIFFIINGKKLFGIGLIGLSLVLLLAFASLGLKIEHEAGYYECPNCKERYVPEMSAIIRAPHFGTTRKMRCPHCGKKGYHKKVISKQKSDS